MREISLSVANFEAAVCVCVSGMADATGWHKCSADGDTVGTKLCENCAFLFVDFCHSYKHTYIPNLFPIFSLHILHYIHTCILYYIHIHLCI